MFTKIDGPEIKFKLVLCRVPYFIVSQSFVSGKRSYLEKLTVICLYLYHIYLFLFHKLILLRLKVLDLLEANNWPLIKSSFLQRPQKLGEFSHLLQCFLQRNWSVKRIRLPFSCKIHYIKTASLTVPTANQKLWLYVQLTILPIYKWHFVTEIILTYCEKNLF